MKSLLAILALVLLQFPGLDERTAAERFDSPAIDAAITLLESRDLQPRTVHDPDGYWIDWDSARGLREELRVFLTGLVAGGAGTPGAAMRAEALERLRQGSDVHRAMVLLAFADEDLDLPAFDAEQAAADGEMSAWEWYLWCRRGDEDFETSKSDADLFTRGERPGPDPLVLCAESIEAMARIELERIYLSWENADTLNARTKKVEGLMAKFRELPKTTQANSRLWIDLDDDGRDELIVKGRLSGIGGNAGTRVTLDLRMDEAGTWTVIDVHIHVGGGGLWLWEFGSDTFLIDDIDDGKGPRFVELGTDGSGMVFFWTNIHDRDGVHHPDLGSGPYSTQHALVSPHPLTGVPVVVTWTNYGGARTAQRVLVQALDADLTPMLEVIR